MEKNKSLALILTLGFISALLIAAMSYGYVKYIIPVQNENNNTNSNTNSSTNIDLEAFKDMAKKASCADKRNDLYLIDGREVFWVREGSCPDAAYSYSLFGQTPNEILCSRSDSIMGPQEKCQETSYEEFFLSIKTEDANLGLKSPYSLKQFYPAEKDFSLP